MANTERISLHGINREIQAVQRKLKGVRRTATDQERQQIDGTLARLDQVRGSASAICSKVWSVWPAASGGGKAKRGAARGRSKKSATKARSKK